MSSEIKEGNIKSKLKKPGNIYYIYVLRGLPAKAKLKIKLSVGFGCQKPLGCRISYSPGAWYAIYYICVLYKHFSEMFAIFVCVCRHNKAKRKQTKHFLFTWKLRVGRGRGGAARLC